MLIYIEALSNRGIGNIIITLFHAKIIHFRTQNHRLFHTGWDSQDQVQFPHWTT